MKPKLLLIYGYLLPFFCSAVVGCLPWFFGYQYKNIANYFSHNLALLFTFLAVVIATAIPFQAPIISEDNKHVLAVLEKSKVREVFKRASAFQAILIVCASLLVLFLSSIPVPSDLVGFIDLLAAAMITFESIALITNGHAYGSIREKIITAVNHAELKQ